MNHEKWPGVVPNPHYQNLLDLIPLMGNLMTKLLRLVHAWEHPHAECLNILHVLVGLIDVVLVQLHLSQHPPQWPYWSEYIACMGRYKTMAPCLPQNHHNCTKDWLSDFEQKFGTNAILEVMVNYSHIRVGILVCMINEATHRPIVFVFLFTACINQEFLTLQKEPE